MTTTPDMIHADAAALSVLPDTLPFSGTSESERQSWAVLSCAPHIQIEKGVRFRMDRARMVEICEGHTWFQERGWEPSVFKRPHVDVGEAHGYIKRLEIWDNLPDGIPRLIALVRWTKSGWEAMRSGDIRYISPSYRKKGDGKGVERMTLIEVSPTGVPMQTDIWSLQTLARLGGIDCARLSEAQPTPTPNDRSTNAVTDENTATEPTTTVQAADENAETEKPDIAAMIKAMDEKMDGLSARVAAMEEPAEGDKPDDEEGEVDDASMSESQRLARRVAELERDIAVRDAAAQLTGKVVHVDAATLSEMTRGLNAADLLALVTSKAVDAPATASSVAASMRTTVSTATTDTATKDLTEDALHVRAGELARKNGTSHATEYNHLLDTL